jgi:peptide/nickel transport system permease protein
MIDFLKNASKKLGVLVFCLFVLSIIVFWLSRLAPGDPLLAYYGDAIERMNESQREAALSRLSLDKPIVIQYFTWAKNAISGDFGLSHQYKTDALTIVGKFWHNTLLLGGLSYIVTFIFSISLGIFCAVREGGLADRLIYRIGTATSVIPSFFIALIAILIFGVNLRLLPTGGAISIGGGGFLDKVAHLVLPIFVLSVSHIWYYAYMVRNRMIDELRRDYVLLLQVKRLNMRTIIFRHCLKNALPMLITIMAVSISHIIAGTYIVELVFSYPGLGTLTFESAQLRDYNMLSLLTLLTGFVILIANMAGQAISELLDPRMRHMRGGSELARY